MTELRKVTYQGVVDSNNSTSTPLGISGVYTGLATEVTNYGIVYVSVYSDVDSATNGLVIQQSSDGTNWDHGDEFTIPAATGKNFSINPFAKYIRIVYTNGAVAQSEFRLQVILKNIGKSSSHRIQDSIVTDDDAELVKAVLTGQKPNDGFVNFTATPNGNFRVAVQEFGDTPAIDAFGRLRISEPYTIYDSKQLHDKQPLFWDESVGGSATSTFTSSKAATVMATTASASDYVIRQTKQRFNYQPGKSQLIYMTFLAPMNYATKRVGLFDGTGTNNLDPYNGIYLNVTSSTVSFQVAKAGSITESVAQANWNIDTFDGNGPSGITLDLDAPQIMIIDFEWLGVGRIRVGFVVAGLVYYVHNFNHSNEATFSGVYMTSPNLPLRYDIQGSASGTDSLDHICSSIMSEGGFEKAGILRSLFTTTHVDADTAGVTYAVIGMRLSSTYKDITVVPETISMLCVTADNFRWSIRLNPTVGGTFTYSGVSNSAIEAAYGATANTITGGYTIDSGFANSNASIEKDISTALRLGTTIAGVADTVVLCVTPLTASADIHGTITYRELL